jgi:hypothetical protein
MKIAHITTSTDTPIQTAAALCAWDAHVTGHRAPFRESVIESFGQALDCELGRAATVEEQERFIGEFTRALAARDGASEDATHWDGERWTVPATPASVLDASDTADLTVLVKKYGKDQVADLIEWLRLRSVAGKHEAMVEFVRGL